jgi:hypothetical protein
MTKNHPSTPPPELVQQWEEDWHHSKVKHIELEPYIAAQAARWGADQELEGCCEWIPKWTPWDADQLRAHRRPKPPSLKEQALEALDEEQAELSIQNYKLIRAVLESLPDNE